jgi:large subunit ribosomal protein L1
MIRKKSKKFQEFIKKDLPDKKKLHAPADAIDLVKKLSYEQFDAAVEVHVKTGIDTRKNDQIVRGSVVLPHGTGKTKKIAVFAEGEKATEAKDAGADLVGGSELIQEIKQSSKADFDIAIATPDMMKSLASIARVLGPRGLMPSPKNETVTAHIKAAITQVKKGKVDFKNDDSGNVHQVIGKRSFSKEQLLENYATFMETLKKSRPSAAKGTFIQNISISTTMGPGIRVAIQ